MWWLDPGKEVLNVLFNRILAPYVENMDMNQVNYGIGQGQLTLRNLRLKRGALDKFRLPIDVLEGYMGTFTLSLHWMNLGNQPVEILIEDVYLLVVPSAESKYDLDEEEQRAQAAKLERLENAELLHMRGQVPSDAQQSQGLLASLTAKVVNNLQITVKNIHIRYEDKTSVPGHPFAAGITLAGFTAVSVNEQWEPTFIESTAGAIHKLAKLESLAMYFNTDSQSMAGLPPAEALKKFSALISDKNRTPEHQFILKPVSGEGRIVMNHKPDKNTPGFDVQLFFDEIGVALDDDQYRDAISLVDMYHVYIRQHQYRKYLPSDNEFMNNRPRALLRFAGNAILAGVRETRRQWSWAYFAERRDDRHRYVELFDRKVLKVLSPQDASVLEALERKLSYEDIRFYRSIARSRLRKDTALRQRLEEEKKQKEQQQSRGWTSWIWGSSSTSSTTDDPAFAGPMTDEQRQQLYDVLDYDEKSAVAESLQTTRDALKARVSAKLKKGSFALKTDPRGKAADVISVVFDAFRADFIQRPDNFEASVSLGGFSVFDGTTVDTLYSQIVSVKNTPSSVDNAFKDPDDPFFFVKFENNPLDERADTGLTARMRHMEIIYHKGYVEAVWKFFKPSPSQLESVEALLDVASQTLEGLRKETRAGLEYALQTHKTIDIQLDMNAPIIIIPEDVTSSKCRHLVIDAGHIAIESDLADKAAVREIYSKRKQHYGEEDYKRLESLMYDKMLLRLEDAQFVIGTDLPSCRNALTSKTSDSLHLMERINIDLQVQNSIVPGALTLARFKIAGRLPTLQVNLSDTKYKALMRLVEVCIPHFDDEAEQAPSAPIKAPNAFQLSGGLFGQAGTEYNVDAEEADKGSTVSREDMFFEANDGTELLEIRQHIFELQFEVDELRAVVSKSNSNGVEKPLSDVFLKHFSLFFSLAKFDMHVDVKLRSLGMNVVQVEQDPIQFVSSDISDAAEDKELLSVSYTRVQKASPEFATVYESIDQNVDVKISTFIFRAAPEPVLSLYDFIMTTFVHQTNEQTVTVRSEQGKDVIHQDISGPSELSSDKIRVSVKLASVQVILINDSSSLATLSMSTADVSILLHSNTMRITGRLGSLALSDDHSSEVALSDFKQIMSIEGQNFAEFRYQTFDPNGEDYSGIKSSFSLSAGSVRVHFLEQPLHDIYLFVTKLAKLKTLYDAATEAAVQRASEIERMQFDVSVKTPIIIFPSNPAESQDRLVMRLGEIGAQNSFDENVSKITASLRGIQLVSKLYYEDGSSTLKIVDDIDVTSEILQTSGIDRSQDLNYPDTQIAVKISDVKLYLTQIQYRLLMELLKSIPRMLAGAPEGTAQAESAAPSSIASRSSSNLEDEPLVDLAPELRPQASGQRIWTTIDLLITINAVKLHLYDSLAIKESDLADHGIAQFALNDNTLRFKMVSDGASEAQLILRSFTINNTRSGGSKFREIIPAAQHDRNQFMILYTQSGGTNSSALAVITVDSPSIIFAIDPVIALLEFFLSAFSVDSQSKSNDDPDENNASNGASQLGVDFRLDLHDVSISVLENDADPDSQAIRLYINQLSLSQQRVLAITINQLGMSLVQMGKHSDSVRFMDEVDLIFSLDNRTSSREQMTSVELAVKPIIFRASYRDIMLITAITNRAIELYGKSQSASREQPSPGVKSSVHDTLRTHTLSMNRRGNSQHAWVVISKEQLKGSFDGFRLVLIGDMHEQPMLHLKVKPFVVNAKDWSGELQATTTMATQISYWNLTNSHWEPLIDPWTFTVSMSRNLVSGLKAAVSAGERLDVNVSTTFAELAFTSFRMWSTEGERVLQKARGSYAPYRIRNRTGSSIVIWSDVDGNRDAKDSHTKIANEETVDWRFDDWKTMREHVSTTGQQTIGLQFVGKAWEPVRGIPMDREGEFVFSLRPRMDKYTDRLLCSVHVEDNVKLVTIRSTYLIENHTFYPLELMLVDHTGHPVYSLEKIAPGHDYSLPIEAVAQNRIRLQPDQGFGYRWCSSIKLEDLITKKSLTISCPHNDQKEAPFRFRAWVQTDANEPTIRKIPKINLKLRAPIELENLLPFNVQYRIYDKDADQNWKSYLRKGGVMPVHSVELGHLVLLNIDVQDSVFKPSDFAIINTDGQSDFDIESRLTLRDSSDRKLDLRLNYVRYPDSGGAFKVQIYSPYLVVNKTGLPFHVKSARSARGSQSQDIAGDNRPEILAKPTPFMLSHPQDHGHEFMFRVGDSGWSQVFSFEAPAAEIELLSQSQRQKSDEYHIGLSWSEGLGKYKLTKVITLTPRFLIKNNLAETIQFREHGTSHRGLTTLDPSNRCPLHIMRAGRDRLLTIAYPGLNAEWSPPINLEDIGIIHLRLPRPGAKNEFDIVRADIKIDGSTIFVAFNRSEEGWPFIIENGSSYTVSMGQIDLSRTDIETPPKASVMYTLPPRSDMRYAWDYPAAREKKILLCINDARRIVDILEIGNLIPFKFFEGQRNRAVSLDVRADGPQQILRITNYVAENSVYKPRNRSGSLSRSDTIGSSSDAFEAVTEDLPPSLTFNLDLAGIGVSLVNRKVVEVVYISTDSLKFEYTNSPVAQSINVSCGSLQIDNQLHDAIYPVILQPTPLPKESKGIAALPTVQGSIIWLKDQAHGVLFVKYFSILLQALTIETDEDLLFALYDLTQIHGVSWDENTEDILIQYPEEIPDPSETPAGQNVYFEVLELQPIQLALSFMRTERVSSDQKLSIRNPLAVVVNALTMTVGNVNDAPLEMNALAIKDMRLTFPELISRVTYHYRQDVIRQLYRILGSADVIGNPVGLFNNVSSGVADIFYEPYNGVVMHGNRELGIGIAKGAASFVKKTVFGLSDSMTKFTSSVGKGLSAATFDSEYQTKRRVTQRRNRPRHAIYGVTAGGEAFATSVASAVEGIVMKPIQGAESEGALGFFKGVGKGLVGAVTKPAVGVFDLAANLSEGIRNTTTVFDNPARDRVRPPRHVPADGILVPYSTREALGQYWMRDLNNGAYRGESYVAHIDLPGSDNIILLTASKILSFWSTRLRLDWELPFTMIQGITMEDTGIRFSHKAGKDYDRFISISDKSSQKWFFNHIASVVKTFNNRRRMDV